MQKRRKFACRAKRGKAREFFNIFCIYTATLGVLQ